MKLLTLLTLMTFSLCSSLLAQEPKPIDLTLYPRAIETPALKYRLYPTEAERKPGNAATILLRLPWEQTSYITGDAFRTIREWESRPLTDPRWQEFPHAFPRNFYYEIRRAAFRRDALWEYPIGEVPAIAILLPDVGGLREFVGYGVAGTARYHLSRHELDKARESIVVGLSNANHLAQTPFFVNQLVAAAVCRLMFACTDELIAQPESPNLYWALTALPDSLLELKRAASFEATIFEMTFHSDRDFDRPIDADEWKTMSAQLVELLQFESNSPNEVIDGGDVMRMTKIARDELPELDRISADKVAAMSDAEVFVRWYTRVRANYEQKVAVVLSLAPHDALPRLPELQAEMESLHRRANSDVIDATQVYMVTWNLNRKVAALRVVEAIRDYLATHAGRLPSSLADIQAVPAPVDPISGQPFVWSVTDQVGTLRGPDLANDADLGESATQATFLEYHLRVN